ncbi:hypothetical protein FSP39_000241, partial [Pinctada imbricata]
VRQHNAILTGNCQTTDFANAYKGQRLVVFDLTRDDKPNVNYTLIEHLKNGVLFSTKYQSHVKTFAFCKVLCLANFAPDLDKLSADRWDVWHLNSRGQLQSPSKVCSTNRLPETFFVQTHYESREINHEPPPPSSSSSSSKTALLRAT